MNIIKVTFLLSLFLLITGCYTSKTSMSKNDSDQGFQYTSLAQILRAKANLKITGSGEDLTVVLRGERSLFYNNEPLFMLDDVIIGNTYRQASSGIDPSSIATAEIITPANAGRFGSQGGNGVIVFRSKSNR